MRLRRALAAAVAAVGLIGGGASPAISAPVEIGVASQDTGIAATLGLVTTAIAPAGSCLLILCNNTNSTAITSISDSVGTTYAAIPSNMPGTVSSGGFYVVLGSDLPLGTTITVTFGGSLGRKFISACYITGVQAPTASAVDLNGAATNNTSSATPAITTGALSQADEIIVAWTYVDLGSSDAWTEDAAFTSLATNIFGSRIQRRAYRIVSSTSAVTYAPTNGTVGAPVNRSWTCDYITLKKAA